MLQLMQTVIEVIPHAVCRLLRAPAQTAHQALVRNHCHCLLQPARLYRYERQVLQVCDQDISVSAFCILHGWRIPHSLYLRTVANDIG